MDRVRSLFYKNCQTSFQILSDLHLEVGQQYSSFDVPPVAAYLILAGDIGRLIDYEFYLEILRRQTANFESVFLVLGNHEFYGLSFTAGLSQARKLEADPSLLGKLVLLHQIRYDLPRSSVTILGCTLWSKIDPNAREVVQMKVKDFQKIEKWTTDDHDVAHESDLAWLRSQTEVIHKANSSPATRKEKRSVLIVTHHAPSLQQTAKPDQVGNAWSTAFATDLLDEQWWGVKVWAFGHTHFTTEFKRSGIRVVSNQRGYVLPGSAGRTSEQHGNGRFDVKRTIKI